jgi:hypothetical protein
VLPRTIKVSAGGETGRTVELDVDERRMSGIWLGQIRESVDGGAERPGVESAPGDC